MYRLTIEYADGRKAVCRYATLRTARSQAIAFFSMACETDTDMTIRIFTPTGRIARLLT